MIYLFILVLLIILIIFYDINGKTRGRNWCYYTILAIFVLVAGLRWRLGADTTHHLYYFYHFTPTLKEFDFNEQTLGSNSLWRLLNSFVWTVWGRFYVVQLIQAAFVNYLIFRYFKKHTNYIFTCALFYFIWRYFNMTMQEMKASFSVVLCLYGNDFIFQKKWARGYVLYMIGCLFHFSTILILFTPLLFFLRFNMKGYVFLAITFVSIMFFRGDIADFLFTLDVDEDLAAKIELYGDNISSSSGRDNVSILLRFLPTVVYAVLALRYVQKNHPQERILLLEPFVMLGVLFELTSLIIPILYRYSHFYSVYLILFYSSYLINFFRKSAKTYFNSAVYLTALLFIPLIFSMLVYFARGDKYTMYYPYNSVLNRKIDSAREERFNRVVDRPAPYYNEY